MTPRPAAPRWFRSLHSPDTGKHCHCAGGCSSPQPGWEPQPRASLKAPKPPAKSPLEGSLPSRCIAVWSIPWDKHPKQQHCSLPPPAIFISLINGIKAKKKRKSRFYFPHQCRGRLPTDIQGELGAQHADGAGGTLGGELDAALLGHAGWPWGTLGCCDGWHEGIYKARLLGGD